MRMYSGQQSEHTTKSRVNRSRGRDRPDGTNTKSVARLPCQSRPSIESRISSTHKQKKREVQTPNTIHHSPSFSLEAAQQKQEARRTNVITTMIIAILLALVSRQRNKRREGQTPNIITIILITTAILLLQI